jgi:hypothetical protein
MKRIRITSVSFRANGPTVGKPFSHVHVEATAQVSQSDAPSEVLSALRTFVIAELSISQSERVDIEKQVTLDRSIEQKQRELNNLLAMREGRR